MYWITVNVTVLTDDSHDIHSKKTTASQTNLPFKKPSRWFVLKLYCTLCQGCDLQKIWGRTEASHCRRATSVSSKPACVVDGWRSQWNFHSQQLLVISRRALRLTERRQSNIQMQVQRGNYDTEFHCVHMCIYEKVCPLLWQQDGTDVNAFIIRARSRLNRKFKTTECVFLFPTHRKTCVFHWPISFQDQKYPFCVKTIKHYCIMDVISLKSCQRVPLKLNIDCHSSHTIYHNSFSTFISQLPNTCFQHFGRMIFLRIKH